MHHWDGRKSTYTDFTITFLGLHRIPAEKNGSGPLGAKYLFLPQLDRLQLGNLTHPIRGHDPRGLQKAWRHIHDH